ncbi:unnamed protein product [Gongylonema pulchrum]|uniref:Calpain catalytic domain-containing protein n=1 Tax=Gongylonema pulchrum TaxID=637853 RepID=A0A183DTD9_9BILA|nr:unnamed protein product [Gongylonema pulchrum]
MGSFDAVRAQMQHLEPFVLSGCISDWKAFGWTRELLAKIIHPSENGFLGIRLGPKEHRRGNILFENQSKMAYISSLEQFFKWFAGEEKLLVDNNLVDSTQCWGYFDYNDVFDIMDPEHISDISWASLGLPADPVDSAIWIGGYPSISSTAYLYFGSVSSVSILQQYSPCCKFL